MTRTVTHAVTVTTTAAAAGGPCTAHDLTGTYKVLPGSQGAGNIVYALTVTNASRSACTVSGVPTIAYLDASGNALPSKLYPNDGHTTVVTLQPGSSATSEVRFSPDVTPCDNGTATTLRLTMPDGSTLDVTIDPATHLCGGGSLQPKPFTGAA